MSCLKLWKHIYRPPRRVRPVGVVDICPSIRPVVRTRRRPSFVQASRIVRPVIVLCPSVRPFVRPIVVVRRLSIRPVVSPVVFRPLLVRPVVRLNYYLHDVA